MRTSAILGLSVTMLAGVARGLASQAPVAQLGLGAGSVTDVRGVTSTAVSVAPSLSFASSSAALRLGVSGTHFLTGTWAAGGSASLDLRAPLGRFAALTLGTAANATTTSYAVSFATIEATPALELGSSSAALFVGVAGAAAWTSLPRVASPLGPIRSSSVAHDAFGPVLGGRLTVASWAGSAATLGYRQSHARVDSLTVVDRGATLTIANRAVSLTGLIGIQRAPDEEKTFGGIRALVSLSRSLALQLGAESYPRNRLTGALAGRAVTLGLVLRTVPGPRPLPSPAGAGAPQRGLTRLSIRAPGAEVVEVAGDWNGWELVPATRAENEVWYLDLAIAPGSYRYAFRIDRKEWKTPAGAAATEDGFGGRSAWLTVSRVK
jgi:hypothetical protein